MSLPPLNPQKTAAGIVVDSKTLDRVIPASKRADGTTRKQVKIRPGFTPEEDVGRFRSSRQKAADAARGHVPGSRPAASRRLSDLVNQSSWDTFPAAPPTASSSNTTPKTQEPAKDEPPKTLKKDWTEKDLQETNFRWDEESEDEGEADLRAAFAKVQLDPKTGDVNGSELGYPPVAPAPLATSPEPARKLQSVPSRPNAPQRQPSTRQDQSSKPRQKPHPIQGGRKGPIGLAFPPPLSPTEPKPQPAKQLSRSDAADSWRAAPKPKPEPRPRPQTSAPTPAAPAPAPTPTPTPTSATEKPSKKSETLSQAASDGFQPARNGRRRGKQDRGARPPQQPSHSRQGQGRDRLDRQEQRSNAPSPPEQRARKEVEVRQGGSTDTSSLASRVRNLVLDNQARAPREAPAPLASTTAPAPAPTQS